MAKEHAFDISAKINMQDFSDAIVQAQREVQNRFDFKGITCEIDYNKKANTLTITTSSDNKIEALEDIVITKLLKRDLSSKVFDKQTTQDSSGGNRKVVFKIVDYIDTKEAKKIAAEIKKSKIKVNAQIEGDHIRVKGKSLDDLQATMKLIKGMEWDAPIVFENFN
jgi:uncharacterized protein YajQ (UPF0234 family)